MNSMNFQFYFLALLLLVHRKVSNFFLAIFFLVTFFILIHYLLKGLSFWLSLLFFLNRITNLPINILWIFPFTYVAFLFPYFVFVLANMSSIIMNESGIKVYSCLYPDFTGNFFCFLCTLYNIDSTFMTNSLIWLRNVLLPFSSGNLLLRNNGVFLTHFLYLLIFLCYFILDFLYI